MSNELIPNARRDGFENNRTFNEFCDYFKKNIGLTLGLKIRAASKARNNPMKKTLTKTQKIITDVESVLKGGFNSAFEKEQTAKEIEAARKSLYTIPKDAPQDLLLQKTALMDRLSSLSEEVEESKNYKTKKDITSNFSKEEKKVIQAMLEVLTRNFERVTVDSLYKEFLEELKK